jgi:hypothetical protein
LRAGAFFAGAFSADVFFADVFFAGADRAVEDLAVVDAVAFSGVRFTPTVRVTGFLAAGTRGVGVLAAPVRPAAALRAAGARAGAAAFGAGARAGLADGRDPAVFAAVFFATGSLGAALRAERRSPPSSFIFTGLSPHSSSRW